MRSLLLMCCVGCLGITAARADLLDPDEASCRSKKSGQACVIAGQGAGTCQADRCCRNDYSQGVPPGTVCSDCLKCKAPAKPAPKPAVLPPAPAKPAPKPAAVPPAPAKAPDAPASSTKASPEPEGAAPAPSGGCVAALGDQGPWGLGVLLAGLLLAIGLRRSRG